PHKVHNRPEKSDEAPKPSIKPIDSGKRPGADLPKLTGPFPRRALLISVDNYLFMNPINYGVPSRDLWELKNRLSYNLKFPMTQIVELSDDARRGPHAPVKPVIEQVVADFLARSRAQDPVLI